MTIEILEVQERITGLKAELAQIVGVFGLNPKKYQRLVDEGLPDKIFYDGDKDKAVNFYANNLLIVVREAITESRLNSHIELPRMRDAGLIDPNHQLFEDMKNFDYAMAARFQSIAMSNMSKNTH